MFPDLPSVDPKPVPFIPEYFDPENHGEDEED